jgi:hypothetical protein
MDHVKKFEDFLFEMIKRENDGSYSWANVSFKDWIKELIDTNSEMSQGGKLIDGMKKIGIDLKKLKENDFFDVLSKNSKTKTHGGWRLSDVMGPLYIIDGIVSFAKKGENAYLKISDSDGMVTYGEWEIKNGSIKASLSKNPGGWINNVKIGSRFD